MPETTLKSAHLDPDALRDLLYQVLSPRRVLHTLGVEAQAITFAMRWDCEINKARLAALLHDVTKECRNQLKLFEDYGILPTVWKSSVPEVRHAVTGAALAARLGAPGDVCDAIRWHTTGRAGMTALEKILYLADMTEPFRPGFDGLDDVRHLCLSDVDGALAQGLRLSISHVQRRGLPVDPHSAKALDWITERVT